MRRCARAWLFPGVVLCAAVLVAGCGSGKPSQAPGPVPLPSIEPTTSAPPSSAPLTVPPTETTIPPTTAAPVAPAPTAAPKPPALPGAGTADVSISRSGTGHLTAIRLGNMGSYDRFVLEFSDQVPGYVIGYRPLPAKADGSGDDISLPGAKALVMVTMRSASGYDSDKADPTYTGPNELSGKATQVTQAKAAGDFESVLSWAVGLKSKVPFKVSIMNTPPRLVIDFQH